MQVDNLMELPKEKRPPDSIIWHNNPDLLTKWLDRALGGKDEQSAGGDISYIDLSRVE